MTPRPMLPGLLRFEWRYHMRRIAFIAAAVALGGFALLAVQTGYPPISAHVNAPAAIMQTLGLISLFAVFAMTVFCAEAGLRDTEHRMSEIVFATSVGKRRYLIGRFGGALLAGTTAAAVAAFVLMVAPVVLSIDPERVGAVRPLAYGWALMVLVVPNLLLAGAVLFSIAALTRSTLATYVCGVAIYALYWVSAMLVESPLMAGASPTPEALARAALLDPFGLSALFEQTRYWTPTERDVRMVALTGRMLVNRLLWIGVAAAVLAVCYRRFKVSLEGQRHGGAGAKASIEAALAAPRDPVASKAAYRPVLPRAAGVRGWWPALRGAVRLELRHVLRGWSFLALMLLWVFVAGMEAVGQLGGGEYGTSIIPTAGLLLDTMYTPLQLLGSLVIVYYAAELAWRERFIGVDPLIDAAAVPGALLYAAKAAALAVLPMVMGLVAVLVALVVQLAYGAGGVQPLLLLSLLWFGAVPLGLFAIGALALQALAINRWLGLLGGLALAFVVQRGAAFGLEHPMLRLGAGPPTEYSAMDGFGPTALSFAAFMGYWCAVAALIACVSWGVWRRGVDGGLAARVLALPRRWGRSGSRVALACLAIVLLTGGALYHETSVAHRWESSEDRMAWQAAYERAYRPLFGRPQPSVVAIRTSIDLYPEARRAEIAATYDLANQTSEPIDTVWVTVRRDVSARRVELTGARLVTHDARSGVYTFGFDVPLQPQDRAKLRFDVAIDRGGIRAGDMERDVVANGTFLTNLDAYPSLGYRASYELVDPAERRRHGLDPLRSEVAGPHPAWLNLDVTISTAGDQTALGPGRLVASGKRDGRRYFRYATDRPVTPNFAIVSARYAVRRAEHEGVTVEVWHHPDHAANVDRILTAATRSLEVLGSRYGRYPHTELRIAEVPRWAGFGAFALPGMILFPENRGFLSDSGSADVDLITRRVAHEVAHQWWGHTLDPARGPGAVTLVETLAKHSEQLVVADLHGEAALPPLLAFDERRYLAGRSEEIGDEPALLRARDQDYLYYGKGAVVMHSLRDLLGAAAVDRALAALIAEHGGPSGEATSLHLRDALRGEARTPVARRLVDEWLGGRVEYDLRVHTASAAPNGAGGFRLTGRVTVAKLARGDGREVPVSAEGELLDVAVLDGPPNSGRVLYAERHQVVEGGIVLALELPERPAYIVVDPAVRRIDRNRADNARRVGVQ